MVQRIRGPIEVIPLTPTVDTAIYAAGDLLTEKLEFEGVADVFFNRGTILSVTVTDNAKQSAALDVVFFDSDPSDTAFTENIIFDLDDADIVKIAGTVSLTTYVDYSLNSSAFVETNIPYNLGERGTSLFAALVTRGTPTYVAASDLTIRIVVKQT